MQQRQEDEELRWVKCERRRIERFVGSHTGWRKGGIREAKRVGQSGGLYVVVGWYVSVDGDKFM